MFRKLRHPELKNASSPFNSSCLLLVSLLIIPGLLHAQSGRVYYPAQTGEWESRRPEEVGMNAEAVQKVVDLAMANEFSGPRDLRLAISNSFEADNTIVGPTKDRGGPAGMIIKNGYIVAEWGDTTRVDMTFSVTKSYLSTIAGLALDVGLIGTVHSGTSLTGRIAHRKRAPLTNENEENSRNREQASNTTTCASTCLPILCSRPGGDLCPWS